MLHRWYNISKCNLSSIIHGAFGGPDENWFPQLGEKLESLGQKVVIPRFPVDDWDTITKNGPKAPSKHQSLSSWLKTFELNVMPNLFRHPYKTLKQVQGDRKTNDKLCFVGHSLGPLFILHVLRQFNIQLDSAIFVSPFLEKLHTNWQINLVNASFYKTDFDFVRLKRLIPISYTLYSDNDPYVDKKYSIDFAQNLGSSPIQILSAGHMNSEAGYKDFPLVFDLCKTRLEILLK